MEDKKIRLSYTFEEFCSATGLNRTAAYKAIAEGQLKTFKLGKRRMVSVKAAREFIEKLEAQSVIAA